MAEAAGVTVRVTVMHSPRPCEVHEAVLSLAVGATVGDVLERCGHALDVAAGVWGKPATAGQLLRNGDRVEIYRPLTVDPKLARRERFRQQGVRAAGLFSKKGRDTPT